MLRYTHQSTGDLETARNVVQESLITLCHQKPENVGNPQEAWFYLVCPNRDLDIYRPRVRREKNSEVLLPKMLSDEPSARAYGRDLSHQRCLCYQPYGHGSTSSFMAALGQDALIAPLLHLPCTMGSPMHLRMFGK